MAIFDAALSYLLCNEKGLEKNHNDPGGITNCGISLRFLKCLSPDQLKQANIFTDCISAETIENITLIQVKKLYQNQFWSIAPFEKIANQNVCNYIFDMAVNMGISPAIKCTQRAIWAYMENRNVLIDDGLLGNITLGFINRFNSFLLPAIRSERGGDYRLIAQENKIEEVFLNGWINRAYGVRVNDTLIG